MRATVGANGDRQPCTRSRTGILERAYTVPECADTAPWCRRLDRWRGALPAHLVCGEAGVSGRHSSQASRPHFSRGKQVAGGRW